MREENQKPIMEVNLSFFFFVFQWFFFVYPLPLSPIAHKSSFLFLLPFFFPGYFEKHSGGIFFCDGWCSCVLFFSEGEAWRVFLVFLWLSVVFFFPVPFSACNTFRPFSQIVFLFFFVVVAFSCCRLFVLRFWFRLQRKDALRPRRSCERDFFCVSCFFPLVGFFCTLWQFSVFLGGKCQECVLGGLSFDCCFLYWCTFFSLHFNVLTLVSFFLLYFHFYQLLFLYNPACIIYWFKKYTHSEAKSSFCV